MPPQMISASDPSVGVGDRLVVRAHRQGQPEQDAEILEVIGSDGHPAFRVRWDDGRESILRPGSDVFVEHFARRGRTKAQRSEPRS